MTVRWSCLVVCSACLAACSPNPSAPAPALAGGASNVAGSSGGTGPAGGSGASAAAQGGAGRSAGAAVSGMAGAAARAGAGGSAGAAASGGSGAAAGASGGSGGAAIVGDAGAAAAGAGAGGSEAGGAGEAGAAADSRGSATDAGGCAKPGLIFCDDFETSTAVGMPPPAPSWSVELNGPGAVTIDDAVAAHSGTRSVHVSSQGGYQTFFALSGAPVFPAQGALYLRVFIRLGAAMSSGHNTYYKAGAAGSPSSNHETRIGVMNGMLMINQPAGDRGFLSNQNYYTDGNKPGVVFAPEAWTCIEALFDPPHSTIDVWVDGKEVPDLHHEDWEQDPLGSFHFGYEKYAGPDADIWYDDIAVSTQPIGCD